MTISMRASDVTERFAQAVVGQLAESGRNAVIRTLVNYSPAAAQVTTVAVSSASAQDYTLTINGVSVTYTADGSDTTTTIAAGLVALINAEPLIRGQVSASNSTNTITLTGTYPGIAFTVTESETDLGSVMKAGLSTGIDESTELGKKVATAAFTAQVDSWAPTYVADGTLTLGVRYRGVTYAASEIAATDLNATLDALAATLNDMLPANSVLAASTPSTATAITLTAEIAGEEFETFWNLGGEGASTPVVTFSTNKGIATSLVQALAGVSLYALDESASTVGSSDASYAAYAGMKVLEEGRVWVENSQTLAQGDAVYIDTSDAKFYNSTGSTRVLVPSYKWVRSSRSADGLNLGLLEARA